MFLILVFNIVIELKFELSFRHYIHTWLGAKYWNCKKI